MCHWLPMIRFGVEGFIKDKTMRLHRICFLLLAGVFLSGCSVNPSTGRRQLSLFSSGEVAAMGEQAKPEVIAEFGGEVDSQPLKAYVRGVGDKVAAEVEPEYQDIEWEFYVLDTDVINAFALPGGKIFITRGLLQDFTNEAQVAGVLGHEVGHVTARHTSERLSQAWVAQFGLELIGQTSEYELVNLGAGLLAQGVMLDYSRDHENEADVQGLKYMAAAGYDPHAMREVLEVLAEASGEGRPPEFLSTHPYPESRIESIDGFLAGPYKQTQGNPNYRKFGGRFRREAMPYLN